MQEDHERQNTRAAQAHPELLNAQYRPVRLSQQPGVFQGSHAAPAMHGPTFDEYVNPDEGLSFTMLQEALDDHVLPSAFQQDDIRAEYHPRSGIPTKTDHFADFRCHTTAHSQVPENTTPWEPFASRIDFDFAELILKANLTKLQTNELIALIRRAAFERFSVTDYDGICKMWDAASPRHANCSSKKK